MFLPRLRRLLQPPRLSGRAATTPQSCKNDPLPLPLSQRLRQTFRLIPHPTIILTAPPLSGLTLSTLTCLSLSPHPLITFNIKTPSTTSSAMHRHRRFTVHILSPVPHSAHLANAFAQVHARHPSEKTDPFKEARGGLERDDAGCPTLGTEDGVLARLVCEKFKVMEVEDHEIWVGKVLRIEDEIAGDPGGRKALMYADRKFRRVGRVVVPEKAVLQEDGEE